MTKEEFILITKMPEVPMHSWFEYYVENGGVLDFNEFERIFSTLMWHEAIVTNSKGDSVKITHAGCLHRFYEYYKKKFGLWQEET